jgi:hypothetical protein
MSRIACTLFFAGALSLTACSKNQDTAGSVPAPKVDVATAEAATKDLATPAGLTNELTSKLGISEAQATAALGSVLGMAKGKLSPADYSKLSGAIPGADKYLAMAPNMSAAQVPGQPLASDSVAAAPVVAVDSAAAGATDAAAAGGDLAAKGTNAAAAAGESAGMAALSSEFSKIGIPPEAAKQFVPVLTDYVGKVGGPEAATILKGLF